MPSFWRRYSKGVFGKGLVKISTICSIEGIEFNWTTMFVTFSLKKWYLIGMCLVLEWSTVFLDILMALVLSQWRGMGSTYFTSKYASVWIIQIICLQWVAVAMYSAYVVENDIEPFFLLSHRTKESPKKNAPPLVIFLSSKQFSQSTSEYVFNWRFWFLGYQRL